MTDKTNEYAGIPRDLLSKYFGKDPRLVSAFENQSIAVQTAYDATTGTVGATNALQDATVVTLSGNDVFNNEFILTAGSGIKLDIAEGTVTVKVDDSTVARCSGYGISFVPPGPGITLLLPIKGTLLSDQAPATLFQPKMPTLINAATQAEAAAAGVPLWGVYRDGNDLKVRNT
jgi:hypothetical protein